MNATMNAIRVPLVLALSSIVANAQAQRAPDFSGVWNLDTTTVMGGGRGNASGIPGGGGGGQGGGTGLGPPAVELTIRQSDSLLSVDERRNDSSVVTVVYRLDGKTQKNHLPVGRNRTAEAEYRSRWDGARLITSIKRTVNTARGDVRVEYRELRYLSSDSAMVVEVSSVARPAGRKALYRR